MKNNFLEPVKLKNVSIKDKFWGRYSRLIRDEVIPYQWDALNDKIPGAEPSFAIRNFKVAAGELKADFGGVGFEDSDVAKWLEAVSYILTCYHDEDLEKKADETIDLISRAQREDGYINTYFMVKEPGNEWTNLLECHELYCAGHMIEAAVAYYEATGKKKLLDVVCRFVDHIDARFGSQSGKKKGYPGHPEIELALIKLYRITGEQKYLALAQYFIDERGKEPYYFAKERQNDNRGNHFNEVDLWQFGRKYLQAHKPIRQQDSAEGHAVRATYLYSAMADLVKETGDSELYNVCKQIWNNIIEKRMYIIGGIGSTSYGEAFTFDYDLPNDTMYCETCASIGLFRFAHRMLQIEPDSQYADVMERALYNNIISGIALDGKSFFYVNPLEVYPEACENNPDKKHVKAERQKWFSTACCPPNIARTLSSIGEYIYSTDDRTIYTHLYIGNNCNITLKNKKINLILQTSYPWEGEVELKLNGCAGLHFAVALRIPNFCDSFDVYLNEEKLTCRQYTLKKGYLYIDRIWEDGDVVKLVFDIKVQRYRTNLRVKDNVGKVALMRGPLVYCLEEQDNMPELHRLVLPKDSKFSVNREGNLLFGVYTIHTVGKKAVLNEFDSMLYVRNVEIEYEDVELVFIPYYAWANRGKGEMQVWIREQ